MIDLESVRPGDELFIQNLYSGVGSIVKVERITPSGRIVAGSYQFAKNGIARGTRSGFPGPTWAVVATDEHRKKIRRADVLASLSNVKWEKLNDVALGEIRQLVKRHMPS